MKNDLTIQRGRPKYGKPIKLALVELLRHIGMGSVDLIRKELSMRNNREFSWGTVKKYLDELIAEGTIKVYIPRTPSRKGYSSARPIYYYGENYNSAQKRYAEYRRKFVITFTQSPIAQATR